MKEKVIQHMNPGFIDPELQAEINENAEDFRQRCINDMLKPAINNMLHMHLPGDMTVDQVEVIAYTIHEIIARPWEFLDSYTLKTPQP